MLLFVLGNLLAQAPDPPPDDGSGEYLDEIPIAGEIYFIIAALGVGAFILLKKQKEYKKASR